MGATHLRFMCLSRCGGYYVPPSAKAIPYLAKVVRSEAVEPFQVLGIARTADAMFGISRDVDHGTLLNCVFLIVYGDDPEAADDVIHFGLRVAVVME